MGLNSHAVRTFFLAAPPLPGIWPDEVKTDLRESPVHCRQGVFREANSSLLAGPLTGPQGSQPASKAQGQKEHSRGTQFPITQDIA